MLNPEEKQFFSLNCRGKLISLDSPKIMGILNVTPDSFSDGGKFLVEKNALLQAEKMITEGADIIDIGAQSTRPNSTKISAKEEISRLGKIISEIRKYFPEILISLDSFYGEVVRFGYEEGIDIVNDISAGNYDPQMLPAVARTKLPYILMHGNQEYPEMHEKKISTDITETVNYFFSEKIPQLYDLGIVDIIGDPGFGFGKTIDQQFQLLDEFEFINFGRIPLLAGISKKSFIYKSTGKTPETINEEMEILHKKLLQKGAKILRVHDVAGVKKMIENLN